MSDPLTLAKAQEAQEEAPLLNHEGVRPEDWTTIKRFHEALEARMVVGLLESEGIPARLLDELTVNADWFLSNAIGGVKLQIPKDEVERAAEVLKEQLEVGGMGDAEPWGMSRLAPIAWFFLILTAGGYVLGFFIR